MTEEKNIYYKQTKLLDPTNDEVSNRKIIVYGAGSIGSHVVIGLAKLGFKNIEVIDFDVIEESNLPAQFYPSFDFDYIKLWHKINIDEDKILKIDALKDICSKMTGVELTARNEKIDETSTLNIEMNSIHICCFDSIEARKLVFDKLRDYPVHFIDGRIGGFNIEKYYVNMLNEDTIKEYEKTLEGTFSELLCGEKCLWAVNCLISAKILADVIKITKGIIPNTMFKTNLMGDIEIKK